MKKTTGFSLIELLITVAIVGILSALSFPLYSQYTINEKRLEAKLALNKLAGALENYFLIHNTYAGVSLSSLGLTEKIANNRYQLIIVSATKNEFKLSALPFNDQANDHLCATLSLNSLGEKSITGDGKVEDCW